MPRRVNGSTGRPASWANRLLSTGVVDPATLTPHPQNFRTHPPAQRQALAAVLRDVGWVQQVIVNQRTGHLLDGHLRVALAVERHEPSLPVGYVDLSEDEERLVLATLDPIAALAEADAAQLAALLQDVQSGDVAIQQLLADLATSAGVMPPDAQAPLVDVEPQLDRAEELRAQWGVEVGQLWALGRHRVLCGDCTDTAQVAQLMQRERAALCLTDPPYGIGEAYAGYADTREALQTLIAPFLSLASQVADVVLVFTGTTHVHFYPSPTWTLAWACPAGTGVGPWGFCCWQPVLAYGPDPYLAAGQGSRPDFLSQQEGAANDLGHPCAKPLGVWRWFLERGSVSVGDRIYDPFLGAGTTLIACEQLGRRCYGVEIAPGYVAVTLQRWADLTGERPERV
jgi:hypothetical protein